MLFITMRLDANRRLTNGTHAHRQSRQPNIPTLLTKPQGAVVLTTFSDVVFTRVTILSNDRTTGVCCDGGGGLWPILSHVRLRIFDERQLVGP